MREVIISPILQGLDQKKHFRADTRHGLEILHHCGKRVKTKSRKNFGANSYICRSFRTKTGRGHFCFQILKRVKK